MQDAEDEGRGGVVARPYIVFQRHGFPQVMLQADHLHSAPCQQDHGPADADDVPEVNGEGARGCRHCIEGDLYRARREEGVAGNVADLIDGEDRWNDERTQQPQRDDRPQQAAKPR